MIQHRQNEPLAGAKSAVMPSPQAKAATSPSVDQSERWNRIAVAAYRRAEARGFEPCHELDDWLAAEAEIEHALNKRAEAVA
jgi:hypothetical protein